MVRSPHVTRDHLPPRGYPPRPRTGIPALALEETSKAKRPTPGFVGIADQKLSYDASQIDDELDRTFGRTP